jgi:hypothetical protein
LINQIAWGMIKELMKLISENYNTGCYSPPPLKEISSWDLRKGGGAQETMKNNPMMDMNQGVYLIESGRYADNA